MFGVNLILEFAEKVIISQFWRAVMAKLACMDFPLDLGFIDAVIVFLPQFTSGINLCIVLLSKTSLSFFRTVEIQVSKALGLGGFSVEHNLSTCKLVSLGLEELVEVLVKSNV